MPDIAGQTGMFHAEQMQPIGWQAKLCDGLAIAIAIACVCIETSYGYYGIEVVCEKRLTSPMRDIAERSEHIASAI